MKKVFLIVLLILIPATSAWATIYKWVDDRGVVNFADDYSSVPPHYRANVDEINIPAMGPPTPSQPPPENTRTGSPLGTQAPPISQPMIREGDFAIKLVQELRMGQARNEAEAESILGSAGIVPKNGWIADYPVTPDIIGELERSIGEAAESGRLPMGKNEALKTFRTTALELELPIIFEVPNRYAGGPSLQPPPPYAEPSVVDDYYNREGPPIVTYYPPPPDYNYLYDWIPNPFWSSGFYFPGYYMLHDFNRVVFFNGHPCVITNHVRDHSTGRVYSVHPERRHGGKTFGHGDRSNSRVFNSAEARNGARSILERSHNRAALGNANTPRGNRAFKERNVSSSNLHRPAERQTSNRESRPSGLNGRNSDYGRPSINGRGIGGSPRGTRPPVMNGRAFSRPETVSRPYGANTQRPSSGQSRSFSPPSRTTERSLVSSPGAGGNHLSSSSGYSRGFPGQFQGGIRGGGSGHGGSRF